MAVPVMVLLLVLGPRLLPEFRDPEAGRLDLISAALSMVAMLAVIYGLKQIAQDGPGWLPALSILAGLAPDVVFRRRQRKLADPLIDLRLFRVPALIARNTLSLFAAFGAFLFIAQYLQLVLGLSPLEAGLSTLPSSCALIVGSLLAPVIVRRVRPAFAMAAGLVVAAVGLIVLTQVAAVSGLAVVVAGSFVLFLGVAPVVTLGTDLIVGTAPPERAGAASALSETSTEFGGALGIAVLGSIGAAVYRSQLTDAALTGISPEATEAARETLGGAVAGAEQLPDQLSAGLLDAARGAFTQGLRLTAVIGGVLAASLAILAAVFLRRVNADSRSEEPL